MNHFDDTIKYQKTADYGNTNALNHLPSRDDNDFDKEESYGHGV